ncbi:nam9p [Saccharomyces arboricola H-6]|uniref:Small ribosomal subunit protein uS4m n=1 Tax=Saccharomyces arboricola (strain H-6 / AS 2.3317 / CBS 10644) TaxID=1160507 RepID=J8Q014_SACAR|nr:nam9p [Saccharomyces arboricola H-6]
MPRKANLLKSLARGRVRTSFNKYNLFNLYKKGNVDLKSKSLYQQKWTAKQETRAYHGEHLTEKRWQTAFKPKLDSVAQLDASLRGGEIKETPFLLQTFAVLEKRLDFALFRAMFASSVRQARQFILHGNVRVNGIKIKHPSYTLKPGDMFSVRPDKVLEALGSKKPSFEEALKIDKTQIILWNKYVKEAKTSPKQVWENKLEKLEKMADSNPKKLEFQEFLKQYNKNLEQQQYNELKQCTQEGILCRLLTIEKQMGNSNDEPLSIDELKKGLPEIQDPHLLESVYSAYQEFFKSGEMKKENLSKCKPEELNLLATNILTPDETTKKELSDGAKSLIRSGKKILSGCTKLWTENVTASFKARKSNASNGSITFDPEWAKNLKYHDPIKISELEGDEQKARELINLPWQKNHVYGRKEPKKPFFTPWKPRPFLSPFAILPHHLEISFKTCHAVYLRDPIARPGQSEVISPFDVPVHERAYMYYLRNGK